MDRAVGLVQLHSIRTEHGAWNTQGTEATTQKQLNGGSTGGKGVPGGGDSLDKGEELGRS